MIRKLLFAAALAWPVLAWAQNPPVIQSGPVTPGHPVQWLTTGVVGDAGTAANGSLSSLGITASGPSSCINSDLVTAPGWQQLCFGVTTAGGATFSLQNFGTATAQPLTFVIDGVTYAFPYTVGGVVGPGSSTSNNVACWNNTAGSLLKDCGFSAANVPLVGSNNTFTGTNAFNNTVSGTGITSLFASPPAIGGSAPAAGAFTTISASSTVSGTGITSLFASPPAIGSTAAAAGSFTTLGTSGTSTLKGDVYLGSGRPWIDVRSGANGCAAALGNNSNDDTSAIQCQLTYVGGTLGGGVVFVPCGNYHITSQLSVPAGTFLVGQGESCSFLNAYFSPSFINTTAIDFTGSNSGMNGIFVAGNGTATATQALVIIALGTVGVQIQNSYIEGGLNALATLGIDCYLQNNFIGAAQLSTAISLYIHAGVCKIIGNKIDPPGGSATGYGVVIDNVSSGGTSVVENILIGNDISGYATYAVSIDDSADASGRTAITQLTGNTIGGPVNVHSANVTTIVSGELAGNVTVNGTTAGPVSVVGVLSVSGNHTAAGAICAGNSNVSCSTVVASLPSCGAPLQGTHMFVTDQATAVAYHGAVTGSGAFKQNVMCDGSAWYQD